MENKKELEKELKMLVKSFDRLGFLRVNLKNIGCEKDIIEALELSISLMNKSIQDCKIKLEALA